MNEQTRPRECGTCSMCCYVLAIDEPLYKPAYKWCQHCRAGNGCSIYADRPQGCRDFKCLWLAADSVPDRWFPERARMVLRYEIVPPINILSINVDQQCPNRWREGTFYSDIKRFALNGLKQPPDNRFATRVVVGKRVFLVLPHREIEIAADDHGIFIPTGPDQFEWLKTKSAADTERLIEKISRNPALRAGLLQSQMPGE